MKLQNPISQATKAAAKRKVRSAKNKRANSSFHFSEEILQNSSAAYWIIGFLTIGTPVFCGEFIAYLIKIKTKKKYLLTTIWKKYINSRNLYYILIIFKNYEIKVFYLSITGGGGTVFIPRGVMYDTVRRYVLLGMDTVCRYVLLGTGTVRIRYVGTLRGYATLVRYVGTVRGYDVLV